MKGSRRTSRTEVGAVGTKLRQLALTLIHQAGSGHPGSCLSAADLIAALYFGELRIRPGEPHWERRDRFVLSKGHACPSLYAAMCLRGFFKPALMRSFRTLGGALQGEPAMRRLAGLDASSGSLGQGLSVAVGMALGARHRRWPLRVYALLGDGELQEGEVWEAAMSAAHYRLGSLCAIVDYNKLQSDDLNENILALAPLDQKWRSFGWNVVRIDGHSPAQIQRAFARARKTGSKPTVILAHTVKGKGVRYMEGQPVWHGSLRMTREDLEMALTDLGVPADRIRHHLDGSLWNEETLCGMR